MSLRVLVEGIWAIAKEVNVKPERVVMDMPPP
jgi:hypothetical protein